MQSPAALWRKWTQTQAEAEAAELVEEFHLDAGGDHDHAERIDCCRPGEVATVTGLVRSISLHPRSTVQTFEADVFDGTGSVTVVWLGRHRVLGIDPGRRIVLHGRLAGDAGHRVMFNPRYELKPATG